MVRCTFSPARAWRPAVVARLARTLGIRNAAVCCASRKCACRRELNGHNAAEPRVNRRCWLAHGSEVGRVTQHKPAPHRQRARHSGSRHQERRHGAVASNWSSLVVHNIAEKTVSPAADRGHTPRMRTEKRPCWPAMRGAERHAKLLACAADAGYRDCSCRGGQREADRKSVV